jgi:hypothetical protein
VKFETTDELPWHDPRVPESGAKAEALRTANAQKRTGMSGLFAEVNDPSLNAHPLSGRKKRT